MKKTVLEWYETFPEPYRSQAIENTKRERLNEIKDEPYPQFAWIRSPQGNKYWQEFTIKILKQKP
jgi:hypothetical protein